MSEPESTVSTKPPFTAAHAKQTLSDQFGLPHDQIERIKELDSYDDQNFYINLGDGDEVVLKITNWKDSEDVQLLGEQTLLMVELGKSIPCSIPRQTVRGELLARISHGDGDQRREYIARLFTFLPGKTLEDSANASQAFQWGALLGRMHSAFLQMNFPTIKARSFIWSWENVSGVRRFLNFHQPAAKRDLIEASLDRFDEVLERLKLMKRELLHGDLNERNVLVNSSGEVYAVLDFGDCQGGPLIWDVALLITYVCLALENVERDLVELTGCALAGYCQHMPQVMRECEDFELLRTLVCARFSQSLTLGLQSFQTSRDPYVLTSQKNGWPSLHIFSEYPKERFLEVWGPRLSTYDVSLK